MLVEMAFRPAFVSRAIAKVGMNLAAHLFGEAYVATDELNPLRNFILGKDYDQPGEEGRFVQFDPHGNMFRHLQTSHQKHWLMLFYKHPTLFFCLRLYGTGGYVARLGDIGNWPSRTMSFEIATVNYAERKMQRLSEMEIIGLFQMP
jgi:hypothetical protein